MKDKYFFNISIVRSGGEDTVPHPEKDEVVVYQNFMTAGLRFPLHKMLVVTPSRIGRMPGTLSWHTKANV
jgi:hypothetical protein